MYRVIPSLSQGLIESRLSGLLSVETVLAYAATVEPFIEEMARRGPYRMLIDVSECVIQPQEVVAAFQEHVAGMPQARRLAVVTGNSTVRMQVRRIMGGPGMAMFGDRDEALAWLARAGRGRAA